MKAQVSCIYCLKSAGLYDFFGVFDWCCVALFEGTTLSIYYKASNASTC